MSWTYNNLAYKVIPQNTKIYFKKLPKPNISVL